MFLFLPNLVDIAAMSNATTIIVVTHLYQVFPKNPTWFSGKKRFALISSVYMIHYYKIKITCHEIVLETNTTSSKHTPHPVQAKCTGLETTY